CLCKGFMALWATSEYEKGTHCSSRLEAVQEIADQLLPDVFGAMDSIKLWNVVASLREEIETVVFGQPSKYIISSVRLKLDTLKAGVRWGTINREERRLEWPTRPSK